MCPAFRNIETVLRTCENFGRKNVSRNGATVLKTTSFCETKLWDSFWASMDAKQPDQMWVRFAQVLEWLWQIFYPEIFSSSDLCLPWEFFTLRDLERFLTLRVDLYLGIYTVDLQQTMTQWYFTKTWNTETHVYTYFPYFRKGRRFLFSRHGSPAQKLWNRVQVCR